MLDNQSSCIILALRCTLQSGCPKGGFPHSFIYQIHKISEQSSADDHKSTTVFGTIDPCWHQLRRSLTAVIALNILMAGPSLISRMAVRSFCKGDPLIMLITQEAQEDGDESLMIGDVEDVYCESQIL